MDVKLNIEILISPTSKVDSATERLNKMVPNLESVF